MESHTHTHDTVVHSMAVCPQQSFSECWKRGDLRRVSMEINRYLRVPRRGTKEHKEGKGNFPVPGCLPAWWLLPAGCSDFSPLPFSLTVLSRAPGVARTSHFTSFFFCTFFFWNLMLRNLVMPVRENEEIRSSFFFFNTADLLYVSLGWNVDF